MPPRCPTPIASASRKAHWKPGSLRLPAGSRAWSLPSASCAATRTPAPAAPRSTPHERLARKLRKLDHQPLAAIAAEGSEFTLLVARRLADGTVVLLGEVADDALLLERAARKLLS